jgi:hypothetical protein
MDDPVSWCLHASLRARRDRSADAEHDPFEGIISHHDHGNAAATTLAGESTLVPLRSCSAL